MVNNPPELAAPPKIRWRDGPRTETLPLVYGRFTATDADGDSPIKFLVTNAIVDTFKARVSDYDSAEVVATHRVEGTFGTLYYNENTGHYLFTSNLAEINNVGRTDGFKRVEAFEVRASSPVHDDPERTSHSTPQELVLEIHGADEDVRFTQSPANDVIEINENVAYTDRTDLFHFQAVSNTDANAHISYSIITIDSSGFQMHDTNGILSYRGNGFDHETIGEISITVIANGANRGLSREIITIRIVDVDEPLEFTVKTFTLLENRAGSSNPIIIGHVHARDPDDDGNPHDGGAADSYRIVSGSLPTGFSFDGTTGQITYTGPALNYEAIGNKNIVNIEVEATLTAGSGAVYTKTDTVQVRIDDEDEQPSAIGMNIIDSSVTSDTRTATHLATFTFTECCLGDNVAIVPADSIFEIRANNQ